MNYNKLDYFLLPFTFLCFLLSTYLLIADQFISKSSRENLIGEITSKSNTVKTKKGESLFWDNANRGTKLEQNDKIYTHHNSEAQIDINGGPKLKISENTLLSLSQFSKNKEITVSKGYIIAELNADNKDFKVNIGNKTVTLNSNKAKIRISSLEKGSSISIIDGEIDLIDDKKLIKLKKGNIVTSTTTDDIFIKKPFTELLSPKEGAVAFASNLLEDIYFSWKGNPSGLIQISKDISFRNILLSKNIKNSSINIPLKPSKYFWRIKNGKKVSIKQSFTVIPNQSTTLLSPKNHMTFIKKGINPHLLLSWKDSYFSDFDISINERVISVKNKNIFQTNIFGEGEYTWKVRPTNSKESAWSNEHFFTIKEPPLPTSPTLLAPQNKYELIIFPNAHALFRWSSSKTSTTGKYNIQIATDEMFNELVLNKEVETNTLKVKLKKGGKYYWRVKELDELNRVTQFSMPNKVSINLYKTNMLPATGAKLIINRPSKKVEFKWKDLRTKKERKVSYTFQLSKSPTFDKIDKSVIVNTNYIETAIPTTGIYYWRTKISVSGKDPYYGEPQRVTISPTPPPIRPKIQERLDLELKIIFYLNGVKSFFSNLIDLFIPSTVAAEINTSVKITWDIVPDTKTYFLEIYEDENLKNKIINTELKTNVYNLKNIKEGIYYWRISTLDFWDRKSEYSNISILSLKLPKHVKKISSANLVLPKNNSLHIKRKKKINFQWTKSPEAIKYKIYISKNKKFSSIYLMRTLTKNSYKVSLSEGKYYWKIVSINKYGRSNESTALSFKISKDKTISISKNKKSPKIKEIEKEKSFFYLQYNLVLSSLNQQYPSYSITAKDPIFTSFEIGNHFKLINGAINTKISRFSGEVFENKSYGLLEFESNYEYSFMKNVHLSIGLSFYSFNTYILNSGLITAQDNSSISYPMNISYLTNLRSNRNRFSISYSIGSLSKFLIRNTFDYNFKRNRYLSIGMSFENYSSTVEESDFTISNITGFFRYNISY